MNKLLAAASVLAISTATSFAADLPMKAPYRAVEAAPYSWNGFYLGATVGAVGLATDNRADYYTGDLSLAANGRGGGALAGITGGYNYQMGTWLLGVEADYSWGTAGNSAQGYGIPGASTEMSTFGTVRARFGYVFDRAVVYATGGAAFAHLKGSLQNYYVNVNGCTASFSRNRTGWTAGGGIEYALNNHFSVKAEALFADFGKVSTVNGCGCGATFKNTATVGRVGLNYKY